MKKGATGRGARSLGLLAVGCLVLASVQPATAQNCAGDCDSSGSVRVNELVLGVTIALQGSDPGAEYCGGLDTNNSRLVEVNELVAAVNNLLRGCPTVSASPTPTPTTMTGSPTPGGGLNAARMAGASTVLVNSLGAVPALIAAVANGIEFGDPAGAAVGIDGGTAAAACAAGGTATRTGNLFPGFNLHITLNNCRLPTADGFVTFIGEVMQSGFSITFSGPNGSLLVRYEDTQGNPTLTLSADLTAMVSGIPGLGGACEITSLTIVLNGTMGAETSDGVQSAMGLTNTTVAVTNISLFSEACVPLRYRLTFNGNAVLSNLAGSPVNVMFNAMIVDVDDSVDPATFQLSGGISSTCLGGAATISTQQALTVRDDEVCPRAGALTATSGGRVVHIFYRANQNVEIDVDGDDVVDPPTYPQCQDPRLYQCLA
jgi:hypothetical protein